MRVCSTCLLPWPVLQRMCSKLRPQSFSCAKSSLIKASPRADFLLLGHPAMDIFRVRQACQLLQLQIEAAQGCQRPQSTRTHSEPLKRSPKTHARRERNVAHKLTGKHSTRTLNRSSAVPIRIAQSCLLASGLQKEHVRLLSLSRLQDDC